MEQQLQAMLASFAEGVATADGVEARKPQLTAGVATFKDALGKAFNPPPAQAPPHRFEAPDVAVKNVVKDVVKNAWIFRNFCLKVHNKPWLETLSFPHERAFFRISQCNNHTRGFYIFRG